VSPRVFHNLDFIDLSGTRWAKAHFSWDTGVIGKRFIFNRNNLQTCDRPDGPAFLTQEIDIFCHSLSWLGRKTGTARFTSSASPVSPVVKSRRQNKEQRTFVRCSLACTLPRHFAKVVFDQSVCRNYWLSGRRAWQAASVAIAAPVGCTRTTASSKEQKLRIPVWLTVIGTPEAK